MCGILFTNDPSIPRERFMEALNSMKHRGPDSPNCYARHNDCQLGHNRLEILDLDSRSNQPFYSPDRRFAMIYNGEIYNYRELIREYGLQVSTTGDTEVLLALYLQLGPKMLPLLNGMFTLVIVDTERGTYFAARDRLGIKPLYKAETADGIVMGSELAAVLHLTGPRETDDFAIRQYRKMRIFFNNRTLYRGIEMFPAASFTDGERVSRWWELPLIPKDGPSDEELTELVESAVDYRCISDVPVGSYLSGGLDSTVVAALSKKPDTWTVGFADNNEFPWAREAADAFASRHTETVIDREEFLATARDMIIARKEPLSVPNEVLLYLMTRRVKERNTVILSGEGADELFFGYDRIFRWAAAAQELDRYEFASRYAYGSADDREVVEDALGPFLSYGESIHVVAAFFQIAHLHGLLRRLDNSTMLCSVEARVPFCDHRLVERLAGTPFDYRLHDDIVKAPLKRISASYLPRSIIKRKKVGFPVDLRSIFGLSAKDNPMDHWFSFNLQQLGMEAAS